MILNVRYAGDINGLLVVILVPIVFLISAFLFLWLARKNNSNRHKKVGDECILMFTITAFPKVFIGILTYYFDYFYFESAWYILCIPLLFYIWYLFYKKVMKIYRYYDDKNPILKSD